MYGTILAFIKFNNDGTWRLNEPRRLFHSFCCTTQLIFEPLRVYKPSFSTDKYSMCLSLYVHMHVHVCLCVCLHVYVYVCDCVCIHVCMCVYV